MEWLTNPEIWIAFFTLTALEIVLGIDNIIMISILVSRMHKHMQARTRIFGLALAMITRILLLLSITWVMQLTADLFVVLDQGISGRDLILFFGGLFLLWKSSQEMYHALEGEDETHDEPTGKGGKFIYTIIQIAIIDIVPLPILMRKSILQAQYPYMDMPRSSCPRASSRPNPA